MTDCVICGSELTVAKERACITCPSCDKKACNTCTRRYLSETHDMPHCLFCRKSWVHTFMLETFPSSFLNGPMKTSRQQVLLNEQKAMLPASHGDVQAEVGKRKRDVLVTAQRKKVADTKALMRIEQETLHALERGAFVAGTGDGLDVVAVVKNQRSYKCPGLDCRGFLADWKCSVCELDVCKKCLSPLADGHVCDEGAVETVRMLARDTKPCPGCGEGIMKIVGGCDQMWCTGCQTTFSWNTGKKTHGMVHNPHYFDYLRKNGAVPRNPLDVECGGMPTPHHVTSDCREPWYLNVNASAESLRTYMRNLNHNHAVESPAYPTTMNVAAFNTNLRVKFLMGEIEEPAWRDSLYKNEKKHYLKKELGEILALVDNTGVDIVRRLHAGVKEIQSTSVVGVPMKSRSNTPPFTAHFVATEPMTTRATEVFRNGFKELEALRSYANDHLDKVGVSFGCKFPQFGHHFQFLRFGMDAHRKNAKLTYGRHYD